MPRIPIHFFSEDIPFVLPGKTRIRNWLQLVISAEQHSLKTLNFIFCTDAYLLAMNKQYLNHHTLTDVITFDHSELDGEILGDIFISVDRTQENAGVFHVSPMHELHRVMVHGTLHLLGYGDKTAVQKKAMRAREDLYLALLPG